MFGPVLQPRNQYPELFAAGRDAIYKIREKVERGIQRGELRQIDNIASIAHTVWAAVHGVTTLLLEQSETFGYQRNLDLQAEKSMRMVLAGFCNNPEIIAQLPAEPTPYPPL